MASFFYTSQVHYPLLLLVVTPNRGTYQTVTCVPCYTRTNLIVCILYRLCR